MTTPNAEMREVAKTVLAKAIQLDGGMVADRGTVTAWAECFELAQKVWPTEARRAVIEHYSKPGSWRLTPGDVIAYCGKQPPWSSREHARQFIETWGGYPYSTVIEAYTGHAWPDVIPPEGMKLTEERAWLATERGKWVADNIEMLVDALMARKYEDPEAER
jgi:hypothetical protein